MASIDGFIPSMATCQCIYFCYLYCLFTLQIIFFSSSLTGVETGELKQNENMVVHAQNHIFEPRYKLSGIGKNISYLNY